MQGHDPGGSPLARRLHHRRADRAQAGDGGRPDRHRRPRRGRTAAQALALHAAGAGAVLGAEHRCAGAGRSGDHRRPEGAAGGPGAWAPEGTNWGEKAAKTFREEVRDALNTPSTGSVAATRDGSRARRAAAQYDCDLRCRRQPAAGRAEMGILRAARIPHLERARLHGLCGAGRAGRAHGVSGPAGGRLHRRRRLPDDGRGTADRATREPADHRASCSTTAKSA